MLEPKLLVRRINGRVAKKETNMSTVKDRDFFEA
jgi:hypothetical protein